MARYSGSALYITYAGNTINSDFRTLTTTEEAGEIDATAGPDQRKVYLSGPIDGEIKFGGLASGGDTVIWNACVPGGTGVFIWGPEGTAAGKQKYTVDARGMNRERAMPYADVVSYSVGWRMSGNVTAGTF